MQRTDRRQNLIPGPHPLGDDLIEHTSRLGHLPGHQLSVPRRLARVKNAHEKCVDKRPQPLDRRHVRFGNLIDRQHPRKNARNAPPRCKVHFFRQSDISPLRHWRGAGADVAHGPIFEALLSKNFTGGFKKPLAGDERV